MEDEIERSLGSPSAGTACFGSANAPVSAPNMGEGTGVFHAVGLPVAKEESASAVSCTCMHDAHECGLCEFGPFVMCVQLVFMFFIAQRFCMNTLPLSVSSTFSGGCSGS